MLAALPAARVCPIRTHGHNMDLATILTTDPASSAGESQCMDGVGFGSGNCQEENGGTYGSGGRSASGFTMGSGN